MPIQVTCACGKQCEFGDELAGWLAKCPACGRPIAVPRTGAGAGPGAQFPVAPRPRRKRRTALFVILGAAGLVVVAGLLVVVFYLPGGPESREGGPPSSASSIPPVPAAAQPAPAALTAAAPSELTLDLGGGVTMKMVLIRPGKFMMGYEGQGRHEVTISKPFYLGATEVTQAQYEAVMGTNPSQFKGATNPVEMVSWNDAAEFCRKLSEKTRQAVRLPTDAEWEYACRAGTQTMFSFGNNASALGDYAWWDGNSGETTHPVGQKKPNAWGLYDMHGNVWEQCADRYEPYPKGPVTDPSGPAAGHYRVLRGESWGGFDSGLFRCAFRYFDGPSFRSNCGGFRCARTL